MKIIDKAKMQIYVSSINDVISFYYLEVYRALITYTTYTNKPLSKT